MIRNDDLPTPVRDGNEWVLPSGRRFPVISGGSDEPPADPPPANSEPPQPAIPEGSVVLSAEQVGELRTRLENLEKRRVERPPSTQEQIQATLDEALGIKNEGVSLRKDAREVADNAERIVLEQRAELRNRDIRDAATQAGFIDPSDAIKELSGQDGDIKELVEKLAESKPHWVRLTTEPDLTKATGGVVDPGVADLAAQIARGRS